MGRKSIYLDKLKFDSSSEDSLVYKYLTNPRLVMLLILIIVGFGVTSLATLPRRLNPEIEIPFVLVTTILPGASPEDIESLVTVPIEDSIDGVEDIKSIESISSENVSAVTVEFESSVDAQRAKDDVQSAIDTINDLPDDTSDPNVFVFDFENQPIMIFALSTKTDVVSLFNFSEDLGEKLESISSIDRVSISGLEKKEIQILVDPSNFYTYNINPFQLSAQIQSNINSIPGGSVETQLSNFPFVVESGIDNIQDIRDLPVFSNTQIFQLSDIADVYETTSPNQPRSYASEDSKSHRAVVMSVYKTRSTNIDSASEDAKKIISEQLKNKDEVLHFDISQDTAAEIEDQFDDLSSNLTQTLILVFATLFIFLGLRQSLIVSLSIPLTFLVSFSVMNFAGLSLNFLTVFSLLLALGLLVDDAIVIVSAMTTYNATGKFDSKQSGMLVWRDFIVPIWSTTLTTVWAFVPLLLSTGIIGEFIKTIPIVVSSTLIASTAVAVLVTLPVTMILFNFRPPRRVITFIKAVTLLLLVGLFVAVVPKDPAYLFVVGLFLLITLIGIAYDSRNSFTISLSSKTKSGRSKQFRSRLYKYINSGVLDSGKIATKYQSIIYAIVTNNRNRRSVILVVVIFSVFSYLLVPLGMVKNEFFPKIDSENLFVEVEMPGGTKADVTENVSFEVLEIVNSEPGVEFVLMEVGSGTLAQDGSGSQSGSNMASISVRLSEENSIETSRSLRDQLSDFTKAKVSVIEQSGGPPVGADVQIEYLGSDLGQLESIAMQTSDHLESLPGVNNVNTSATPSVSKISFTPDKYEISKHGLSVNEVALTLRTYLSGFTLDEARIGGDKIEINYRINDSSLLADEIEKIFIPTRVGPISLSALGKIALSPNPSQITRLDGQRSVTVSAAVTADQNPTEINAQLVEFANKQELPDGYEWKTGGVNEENEQSITSILQAMIVSAILILGTMVIQLGSFRKSVIVLLVIPLAISGVFVIFALTGTPLSFPALIGVLALFGIVVNNSIMVVEKINQNLRSKIKFDQAIADASASRVEPIMFSSLTTIFGLLPITLSDPLWRGLGGAIISGLLVSGVVMLFFIPTVYYSWFVND
ncbi:efflux RND transporter permease subunit [Patescibacteria group bacterium]